MMQDVPARILEHQNTVACTRCGYDIRGLVSDGVCPECGQSIAASLQGDLLQFASPEYLKSLHSGVFLIVSLIIAQILLSFAVIGVAMVIGLLAQQSSSQMSMDAAMFAFLILQQVTLLALLYGWWLFTQPDPAYTGRNDGSKARKLVRITIVIQTAISIAVFIAEHFMSNLQQGPPVGASGIGAAQLFLIVLLLVNLLAWAVSFFAQMMYIRWLSPRIPDVWVYKRAKMLIWLGPLLYVVGSFCIGLGPLIALVLYWNMLDRIRKDLKLIRRGDPPLAA